MRRKMIVAATIAVVLLATVSASVLALSRDSPNSRSDSGRGQGQDSMKMSAVQFHDLWRKLWEDHIWWTRNVILGVLDNLPGNGNYTARLIQNYQDMEDALKPFYGDDAEKLGDLIQDHLLIAYNILVAAKEGNATALNANIALWYENANDIAAFMNKLNPRFWTLEPAKMMWKEHLDLTLKEATDHLAMNWTSEVETFDKVHVLALKMADFFSLGIILQFPFKFIQLGAIIAMPHE